MTFFGTNVGYSLAALDKALFPYANVGIKLGVDSYHELDSGINVKKGPSYSFSGGVIVPVKEHLGLNVEIGYHMLNMKDKLDDDYTSGNEIRVSFGISGLIF